MLIIKKLLIGLSLLASILLISHPIYADASCVTTGSTVCVSFQGSPRQFTVHTPSGYNPATPVPLMIMYHGRGGSGTAFENQTQMDVISDSNNFIIVYPTALNGSWQDIGASNDIDFTKFIINQLKNSYNIDATRIYAVGHSEGNRIVETIACAYSDSLAAFADVAQNMGRDASTHCAPTRPMAAMFIHGTVDPISPYNGSSVLLSSRETAQFWAQKANCAVGADQSVGVADIDDIFDGSSHYLTTGTLNVASSCDGGVVVQFHTITGGGHGWPGASYLISTLDQIGPVAKSITTQAPCQACVYVGHSASASQIIWLFLSQFHL